MYLRVFCCPLQHNPQLLGKWWNICSYKKSPQIILKQDWKIIYLFVCVQNWTVGVGDLMDTLFVIGLLLSFKFRSDFENKSSSPCKAVYILRNVSRACNILVNYCTCQIGYMASQRYWTQFTTVNYYLGLNLIVFMTVFMNVTYGYHLLTLNSICLTESDM